MNTEKILDWRNIFFLFAIDIFCVLARAETIYVDSDYGNDKNPGTKYEPVRTIAQAVAIVNDSNEPGPTNIKIEPGVYVIDETVTFENQRSYTRDARLTIEATILPDDPNWRPDLMPVVASRQIPKISNSSMSRTETYSIKVKLNHVTICGLKFLGNAVRKNCHNCIERIGSNLDDLLVTQCLFQGDRTGADIYCATLATGDRFVVDHCVFKDCGACVVFWDGLEGISGHGCGMHYCIVDNAYLSGVWTCQTEEDLAFHHNIITNSEYVWMRKPGDTQTYRLDQCVTVNNKHFSGYGVASGPIGRTGDEVSYEQFEVVTNGTLVFEENYKSRNYMHSKEGSIGNDLGAGLFTKTVRGTKSEEHSYRKETFAYKEVDGHEILADVLLPVKEEIRAVVLYIHGGGFMFGSRTGRPRKPLLDKLIESNYAAVSIDYRMAPETKLEEIVKDARDACIWIRSRGPSLFNADPNRLGVIGGSAGAFLATACGYMVKPQPQAIVAISGFADFEFANPGTDRSLLKQNNLYDTVGKKILTQGGEDRYKLCFFLLDNGLWPWEILGFEPKSNQEKVDVLLPINHINSGYPATLLIHSKNDQNVPFSQAEKLSRTLTAQKIESELFIVPQGHSSEIIRNYPEAVAKIVSFLDRHLKKP